MARKSKASKLFLYDFKLFVDQQMCICGHPSIQHPGLTPFRRCNVCSCTLYVVRRTKGKEVRDEA